MRISLAKDTGRMWCGVRRARKNVTVGETKSERAQRKFRAAMIALGHYDLRKPVATAALIAFSGCFPIPHIVVDVNPIPPAPPAPTRAESLAAPHRTPPATAWLDELAAGGRKR